MSNSVISEKKSLKFYLELDYPITFYPEEVGGFTVMIKDLPGCMTQGETLEEAFAMMTEAKALWIESCYEDGFPIPLPHTMDTYSGKTMLRMPKYLHQRLAESAKREGTSLNQYLISLLSERDALSGLQAVQAQLADIQSQLQQTQMRPAERSPYLVSEASDTPQPEKIK